MTVCASSAAGRSSSGALLADLSATALAMPFALFPAINADRFGGAPETLGLLTAAVAAGGILGTALSGPVSHVTRPGRAMLFCALGWGGGLVGFGLAAGSPATLGFLVVAGIADVLSVVFRSTVLQTATPDNLRGRTSAAEFVTGGRAAAGKLPGRRARLADLGRDQRGDRRAEQPGRRGTDGGHGAGVAHVPYGRGAGRAPGTRGDADTAGADVACRTVAAARS